MIRPPHAPAIWSDGTSIYLDFPAVVGDRTHCVKLPNSPDGLTQALTIINSKVLRPTVGTRAAPTQYQTDKALVKSALKQGLKVKRVKKQQFSPELRQGVIDILRTQGLI